MCEFYESTAVASAITKSKVGILYELATTSSYHKLAFYAWDLDCTNCSLLACAPRCPRASAWQLSTSVNIDVKWTRVSAFYTLHVFAMQFYCHKKVINFQLDIKSPFANVTWIRFPTECTRRFIVAAIKLIDWSMIVRHFLWIYNRDKWDWECFEIT